MKIGLIGDYQDSVTAHHAIPQALDIAAEQLAIAASTIEYQWLATERLELSQLPSFSALWCVPASPYRHTENVLSAIEWARLQNIPFLGTCGGYQHAALEFAQHALQRADADNAEINPDAALPLISALVCKLYDTSDHIRLEDTSALATLYGATQITEEYFCGYGVNRQYLSWFDGSDMHFTGFDADGDPRALELHGHPFFFGTAFQPERSALASRPHPLITAFVSAAAAR